MEIEQLAPGIVSYVGVMDDPAQFISDLEGLVEINRIQWSEASQSSGGYNDESKVVKSARDCSAISLPPFDLNPELKTNAQYEFAMLHDYLNEQLLKAVDDYRNSHAAGHWTDSEGWQILKYGEGNHFSNHYDDAKKYPRTISMSFYLNDNYEGGEIEFPRFGLTIKPKANQMIMFPSNYVYNHTVHTVKSGLRYAVVAWWN